METKQFVKETLHIYHGRSSNISKTPRNITSTHLKYLQDTHQLSPGNPSNIYRTSIKYLYYTRPIYIGHPPNISRTPIKYIKNKH